jgi:hypothetical protein
MGAASGDDWPPHDLLLQEVQQAEKYAWSWPTLP